VCRGPAVIDVRRHNANFCGDHFVRHCQEQVRRAIDDFDMINPGDRVLVAVSGGKDSLAVWDLLLGLGFEADGLYIGLGIGDYSDTSGSYARRFAESRGLKLLEVDLPTDHGFDIPTGAKAAKRVPCSACGLSKRYLFDRAALEGNYDVLVTGHNLDDEAAVLFGNTLRWDVDYLGRQYPVLPSRSGFPKKAKPLVRLTERESAAYCLITGIDYLVDECPMAAGNRHLGYKELLNDLEVRSPGAKADFYFSYLRNAASYFRSPEGAPTAELGECGRCGAPAQGELCAFCRLQERAAAVAVDAPRRRTATTTDSVSAETTTSDIAASHEQHHDSYTGGSQ